MASYEDIGVKRRSTTHEERTPKRHRVGSNLSSTIEDMEDISEHVVCFGAMTNIAVALLGASSTGPDRQNEKEVDPTLEIAKLKIVKHLLHYRLYHNETYIGVLHTGVNSTLHVLEEIGDIEWHVEGEEISLQQTFKNTAKRFQSVSHSVWSLNINLIGPVRLKSKVGAVLQGKGTHLQIPKCIPRGLRLENPHIIEFHGLETGLDKADDESLSKLKTASSPTTIADVLEELNHSFMLKTTHHDCQLATPLQDYQKQGVDFILQRESQAIQCSSFSLWMRIFEPCVGLVHRHKVTKKISRDPRELYGGILADEMGLGKSLQMLSVVSLTKEQASVFAATSPERSKIRVKSTLIVVPSALLVENWTTEIDSHFVPDTFSVHKFHGTKKEADMTKLGTFDIVITTYATLAAQANNCLVRQLIWYRIILDEAHKIRNPRTKYFRAAASLSAKVRWCLTGTPIQNALEDLGSLVRFLKVESLELPRDFRQHCITPATQSYYNQQRSFDNIRALLKCICLRRTKDLLQLPDLMTIEYVVEMSEIEREQYDQIKETYRSAIEDAVCGRSPVAGYRSVLSALLKLRMVCNHGLSLSKKKDQEDVLALLQTGPTSCAYCGRELDVADPDVATPITLLSPCSHLVCGDCQIDHQEIILGIDEGTTAKCPECSVSLDSESSATRETSDMAFPSPCPNTISSKFMRIVADLKQQHSSEKSIVFSCWKKTLDELASILTASDLPFVLLDGTLTLSARREVLSTFQSSPLTILLMTLGTGSVGLNLTVASRIHLIEPQWNPTIEAQAIGRAARLGQSRQVSVVRYIVKDTVEQYIQTRQNRKMQLADLGFVTGSGKGETEKKLQKLSELRDFLDV